VESRSGTAFLPIGCQRESRAICNPESFIELLGPRNRLASPHLPAMGQAPQFDDGIVVALGKVGRTPVVVVSQDSRFVGGGIGEVNGTKMVTLFACMPRTKNSGITGQMP